MWTKEIAQSLERLTGYSFFEVSTNKDKIMLTPTMIKYVDDYLEEVCKNNYFQQICSFYREILHNSYKHLGNVQN